MWIFLSLLFLIGLLQFLLNLALIERLWVRLLIIFSTVTIICALYPLSMQINARQFVRLLNDYHLLSLTCTIQVIESFLLLMSTGHLIKSQFDRVRYPSLGYISLSPPLLFLLGLFLIQTGALYFVNGISFSWISVILAFGLFALFCLTAWLTRLITGSKDSRLEYKVHLSLLQLLMAMFLPVTVIGESIETTQFDSGISQMFGVWGTMLIICLLGIVYARLKPAITFNIKNYLSRLFSSNKIIDEKI